MHIFPHTTGFRPTDKGISIFRNGTVRLPVAKKDRKNKKFPSILVPAYTADCKHEGKL